METTDVKTLIKGAQEGMLHQLVNLVPPSRRSEALRLVDQFWQASRAISAISPLSNDPRYASCQYVIDAIKLYLTDIDRPANREEIADGVIGRGFRPGKENRTRGNIKKSLDMYLTGQARGKNELKQIGGFVGLASWSDQRWKIMMEE